jgi:Tol biopolymer transport system component
MFRVPRISLLFLLLYPVMTCSGQIGSIGVSPDGKFIAVAYEKDHSSFIYRIAMDTGQATRLTDVKIGVESCPSFSADGKRIAFSYSPGNGAHSRIVIGNVDASDLHPWSAPSHGNDFWPVFLPDNKTIVLARSGFYGSYSPIAQPHPHAWDFYESDLDGTNVRQLTNEGFYMATPASVSPDGKNMVVVTEGVDTPRQIAIYSLNHAEKPMLSLRPHVPKEADRKDPILNNPNYTPDGKSILFMAASNGKLLHGFDYDIYRVDIGSGALERLTDGNGYATDLRVFADGKTAVFLKWRSDWHSTPVSSELYLLDLQTRKVTPFKVRGLD